jgi:hypothetical protein
MIMIQIHINIYYKILGGIVVQPQYKQYSHQQTGVGSIDRKDLLICRGNIGVTYPGSYKPGTVGFSIYTFKVGLE